MIPFGLKFHGLREYLDKKQYASISRLVGIYSTPFGTHIRKATTNTPAFTSSEVLTKLDEYMRQRTGTSFFNTPEVSLQVCLPFVATKDQARILLFSVLFGSDNIKQWDHELFRTTHDSVTSKRMLVYGSGVLDENFPFIGVSTDTDKPVVLHSLPSDSDGRKRIDLLGLKTLRDVEVAQVVGTLLASVRYNGVFAELGEQFISDCNALIHDFIEQERDDVTNEDTTGLEEALRVNFVFDVNTDHAERLEQDAAHHRVITRISHLAHDELALLKSHKGGTRINLIASFQSLVRYYENEMRRMYYSEALRHIRAELKDHTTYEK